MPKKNHAFSELISCGIGPEWVTNYVLDLHSFYLKRKEMIPFNCHGRIGRLFPPNTKATVNILPLVEELNQTKRNFYPTRREKMAVHDRYHKWIREIQSPTVTYPNLFTQNEIPHSSRLSHNFRLSRKTPYLQTFWRSRDGWQIELDGSEKKEDRFLRGGKNLEGEETHTDQEGNLRDKPPGRKDIFGRKFRKTARGLRVRDWISFPERGQDDDLRMLWTAPALEGWYPHHIERQPASSSIRLHKFGAGHQFMEEAETLPSNGELVPDDSVSNPDNHNPLADWAAQGWDEDAPVEEMGWDAGPSQTPMIFNPFSRACKEGNLQACVVRY